MAVTVSDNSVTLTTDPTVGSNQANIIPGATAKKAGVMTAAQVKKLEDGGEDSSIILWSTEIWSEILAQIVAVPPDRGVIVMMSPGTYTMDVPANLDRVMFVGMAAPPSESAGAGPQPVLNIVSPFTLLGNFLYLDCVEALVDTTIWTGGGRLEIRLEGSAFLSPASGASPGAIQLPDNGIMDVSISSLSLLAGNSAPVPFIFLGNNSTLNILCNAGGIVGDFTAALALGAVSANANFTVDDSCVVSPVAFGAGIVQQVFPNGTPAFCPFAPTVPANWSPTPANVQQALDGLGAAKGTAVTGAGGTVVVPLSSVTASSVILLTPQDGGAVPTSAPYVSARVVGTSFTIKMLNPADVGVVVGYQLRG